MISTPCPCCLGNSLATVHLYDEKPQGETTFPSLAGQPYRREIRQCSTCGHFLSLHSMDLGELYRQEYAGATYGDAQGIRAAFQRIMDLPPEQSDNVGRVRRLLRFTDAHFPENKPLRLLDVGSGLAVFLAQITNHRPDWRCTALEPDPKFSEHAAQTLGVETITQDYLDRTPDQPFDLITLNKVLEHVPDPLAMLERCRRDLAPGGLLYLELPDGEAASQDPQTFLREEFFIEHHHAFTMASMELIARQARLRSLTLERLREPSSKYTLRAFLVPAE